MRWLIDGYNVIRRDPDLRGDEERSLEAGRTALLRLLASHVRESPDRFTVVFDGARVRGGAASPPDARLEVVFSRPPQTADDVLIRLARQAGAGAVVISSDRKIVDAARRAGCPVVGAEEFLSGLAAPAGGGAGEKDDDDEERPRPKRGNPRRLSKDARAAQRALRRLHPRPER